MNPYEAAQNAYKPYGDYINPFLQGAKTAYGTTTNQFNRLINTPYGLEDMIMNHYHSSPFAKEMTNTAQQAANAVAARGGYVGTPQEQEAVASKVGQISDADEQQYYQNAAQNYGMGIQGLTNYANLGPRLAGDYYGNLAGLAEKGAAYDAANQKGGLFGALAGGLSGAAAGSAFGPWGAAIGGGIGALGGYFSHKGSGGGI